MVLDKWKAIFIHIPKTGGGSIESALLMAYFNLRRWRGLDAKRVQNFRKKNYSHPPYWTQHFTIEERKKHIPKRRINRYFKFCFVRNPWDRMLSEYFYIKKHEGCNCSEDDSRLKTFDTYLKSSLVCSWPGHAQLQKNFVLNSEGNLQVDFVGRFENLQQDFDIVCNKINIPTPKLPHFNETEHGRYTEYYDDETREIVAEKYAQDIEYFGYKFGE